MCVMAEDCESTPSACVGSLGTLGTVDDRVDSTWSEECEPVDVLQAPKLSILNRKRKVLSNRGRGGKRRYSSSSTSSEPRGVTPLQRVKGSLVINFLFLAVNFFATRVEKNKAY